MNKSRASVTVESNSLQVAVRAIGNSKGVVIPKVILEQSGIGETVEMLVEGGNIILSKPKKVVREKWSSDAKNISQAGEDKLVLGDFANHSDKDWVW